MANPETGPETGAPVNEQQELESASNRPSVTALLFTECISEARQNPDFSLAGLVNQTENGGFRINDAGRTFADHLKKTILTAHNFSHREAIRDIFQTRHELRQQIQASQNEENEEMTRILLATERVYQSMVARLYYKASSLVSSRKPAEAEPELIAGQAETATYFGLTPEEWELAAQEARAIAIAETKVATEEQKISDSLGQPKEATVQRIVATVGRRFLGTKRGQVLAFGGLSTLICLAAAGLALRSSPIVRGFLKEACSRCRLRPPEARTKFHYQLRIPRRHPEELPCSPEAN